MILERRNGLTFIVIVYILLAIIWDERYIQNKRTQIIAHRGASFLAPENTMAAFHKAIGFGADRIELDVQLSKDKKLVVIHDHKVDRTTNGSGFVRDHTLRSLKQLDAGSWFNEGFKTEKIPTLKEIMKQCLGKTNLLIEIKDPHLYPGIEKILAKKIKSKVNGDNIIIQSFDENSIRRIKKMIPSVETCLLISGFEFYGLSRDRIREIAKFADYISPPEPLVTNEFIAISHQLGLKTFAWNVNHLNQYQRLNQLGVDGIVTNIPTISTDSFSKKNHSLNHSIKGSDHGQPNKLLSLFTYVTNEFMTFFKSLQ